MVKAAHPFFAKNRNDETDLCDRPYLGLRIRHCVVLSNMERPPYPFWCLFYANVAALVECCVEATRTEHDLHAELTVLSERRVARVAPEALPGRRERERAEAAEV